MILVATGYGGLPADLESGQMDLHVDWLQFY